MDECDRNDRTRGCSKKVEATDRGVGVSSGIWADFS